MRMIEEGKATVCGQNDSTVFYNPVQEFNRDISTAMIEVFSHSLGSEDDLLIYEGLSATGLRSIRYAKELTRATKVYANDLDAMAYECIRDNVTRNGVLETVTPLMGDCNANLISEGIKVNVVDVDPFGSPAIFIDSAVSKVSEGGLLLVTATDLAVLCGQVPEKCYSLYGSLPVKTPCMHENALRILLYCISRQAAMHGRYIVPQLSFFKDFYIRVAVRVFTKASIVKDVCLHHSMVNYCSQCSDFLLNPLALKSGPSKYVHATVNGYQKCKQCESSMRMGGPIWNGPIHDSQFVSKLLDFIRNEGLNRFGSFKKLMATVSLISEEVVDAPLFLTKDMIFSAAKLCGPKLTLVSSAILNAGYKFSVSHCSAVAIKTDAPTELLWDLVRQYEKEHPIDKEKLSPFAKCILSKNIIHTVDFTLHQSANPQSRTTKLTRFPQNPPNWGPKARPRSNRVSDEKMNVDQVENENNLECAEPDEKKLKTDIE
ncbi:tRNA (guanine(26)-N(2))-dimethyltransferase-like isoform X2 [Convolutriloba macropyga]|uniref:tRNA (guanine(26)-N(2))-dimethyltransferase-like isoform X2 n=1 Tax=Convolutriloba macropyga TaxID=536237 RepID=UPI003F51C826